MQSVLTMCMSTKIRRRSAYYSDPPKSVAAMGSSVEQSPSIRNVRNWFDFLARASTKFAPE
jgi:hypothetical protein